MRVNPSVRVVAAIALGYWVLLIGLLLTFDLDISEPLSEVEAGRNIPHLLGISAFVSVISAALLIGGSRYFDESHHVQRRTGRSPLATTDRYRATSDIGLTLQQRER